MTRKFTEREQEVIDDATSALEEALENLKNDCISLSAATHVYREAVKRMAKQLDRELAAL